MGVCKSIRFRPDVFWLCFAFLPEHEVTGDDTSFVALVALLNARLDRLAALFVLVGAVQSLERFEPTVGVFFDQVSAFKASEAGML